MQRALPLIALALAVVAGACADATEPTRDGEITTQVLADVDAAVGAAAIANEDLEVPEGCRLEQRLDDYGFAVDVVVCDGDGEPQPPDDEVTLDEWIGSADARKLAVALRNAIVLGAGCDSEAVVSLQNSTTDAPSEVRTRMRRVVTELGLAAAACDNDPATWRIHFDVATTRLTDLVDYLAANEEIGDADD